MMTVLNGGFGDGIPPNQPNAARVPSLMMLGVGSLLVFLILLGG